MNTNTIRRALPLTLAAATLFAQGNFGSITGVVLDASNSAVPGASVEAVNLATGFALKTVSSPTGNYLLPNAPNGEYRLTVSVPSFKTYRQQPILVATASVTTANVRLELGSVDQSVTVQAASTPLETSSSGVGMVLSEKAYKQLPLDITNMDLGASGIRQPQQFIFMAPGVTGTSLEHRMNGGQGASQSIQIDGHNWALPNNPGRMVSHPPPFEAIEEFKLNTAQYSAENPTGSGGTQFSFKSGTDQFHGSFTHLSRNDYFNARGFFAAARSPLKLNESAATFGGPVILPRYNGKQRTHFFTTVTRFSRRGLQNAASLTTLPTPAFKQGDFSAWVDAAGARIPVYDPATTRPNASGGFTRDPFPNNTLPTARIGKVGRNTSALLPDPNRPGIQNNHVIVAANEENRTLVSVKLDHSWTPGQTTRLTFFHIGGARKVISGLGGVLAADDQSVYDTRNVMLSHTSVLSARTVNEVRFSLAPWFPYMPVNSGVFPESGTEALGIPNHPSAPGITPRISIVNVGPTLGNGNRQPLEQSRRTYSFGDSLSWVRNRHQLKFGFSALLTRTVEMRALNRMGTFSFNNRSTSLPDSPRAGALGHGYASFLIGDVYSASRLINDSVDRENTRRWELFVQDDIKVNARLTLNLGMNYHIPLPVIDPDGRFSSLDPAYPNPAAGGLPGALVFAGGGPNRTGMRTISGTYYRAFGPRFGFAYALGGKTAVRGGYGIYYGYSPSSNTMAGVPRDGYSFTQSETTLNLGVTPAFNINNGFPAVNVRLPSLDPALKNGGSIVYIHPDSKRPPLSQNWSFGLQRELPARLFLDASYVATKGSRLASQLENMNQVDPRHLSLGPVLNQNITSAAARQAGVNRPYDTFTGTVAQALRPFPQFTGITNAYQGTGFSTYHSLQVKFEKRLSSGLMFMNAYTLSKLIDTGGSARAANDPVAMDTYRRFLEKAVASTDQTHTLVTSWIYSLPFGPGQRFLSSNKIAGNLIGNWRLAGSIRTFSGNPIGLVSSVALPLFGGANRVNQVPGVPIRATSGRFDPGRDRYLNREAFFEPGPFEFGTVGPRLPNVRGPGFFNENLSLTKIVRVREGHQVELRATLFNAANRVIFGMPSGNPSTPNFGQISTQVNMPRQLELYLQYSF